MNNTLLHNAARRNDVTVMKQLMKACPPDRKWELLTKQNAEGETALHFASNNKSASKYLMDSCPSTKKMDFLLITDNDDVSAPMIASSVVKKIFRSACSPNELSQLLSIERKQGLHDLAAKSGDLNTIDVLIKRCKNPEEKWGLLSLQDSEGSSALHYLAKQGIKINRRTFEIIVNACDDEKKYELLTISDSNGDTPLQIAAKNIQKVDFIYTITNLCPNDLKVKLLSKTNNKGYTVLHSALTCPTANAIIEALLNVCPSEDRWKLITIRNRDGKTAFDLAMDIRCPKPVESSFVRAWKGAFQTALNNGHLEGIIKLLDTCPIKYRGKLLDKIANNGDTLLHIAFEQGQTDEIVGLLNLRPRSWNHLKKANNDGDTPLDIAVKKGKIDLILKKYPTKKYILFYTAASNGALDTIKKMLNKCENLKQKWRLISKSFPEGNAFHQAIANGHKDAVEFLLSEVPAKSQLKLLTMANASGDTPLHIAAANGDLETIDLLLKGQTPQIKAKLLISPNERGENPSC